MTLISERVLGGVDRTGLRPFCGHFVPETGTAFLEANYFPVVGDWNSLSFHLSAVSLDGIRPVRASYGLVGFDPTYTTSTFYSSDRCPRYRIIAISYLPSNITLYLDSTHILADGEQVLLQGLDIPDGIYRINAITQDTFTIDSVTITTVARADAAGFAIGHKVLHLDGGSATSGFLNLKGLYKTANDTPQMCFRLEIKNCAEFWIDNMLVDPHEGQYDYFDGNSDDSFPEDYRWMGGRTNRHFSLWYNNYKNTHNRLFSDWDVNEQVYKSGLVEEWAPTGSNIVDHWDAVTSFTPLNWDGPAYYPLHPELGTPAVTNITIRRCLSGNLLPEGPVGATWDDPSFVWDDVNAYWDDDRGLWE